MMSDAMAMLSDKASPAEEYFREIHATLPRLLALADTDPTSPTFGVADRQFWAWKLIDFPNATFQGAVNGLAHLLALRGAPPLLPREAILQRVGDLVAGTRRITRGNGSLEEALPFENSFCVTALVGFDMLRACDDLTEAGASSLVAEIRESVGPLIRFLNKSDETHGFIANHLATAVACLLRWHRLTGDRAALKKADELLSRVLDAQSEEGWFPEYGGADPGYQTLCMTYLADAVQVAPSERLSAALTKSVQFLHHFAHPDGSFGGIYGSRCTRLYYPAGIEALARNVPEARSLAAFMRRSIGRRTTVPLSAIDPPNLIPVFNNYCWAARLADASFSTDQDTSSDPVPALRADPYRRYFSEAGLLVDHSSHHHTVISTHKGGVVYHFTPDSRVIDTGVALQDATNKIYTTQSYAPDNELSIDDSKGEVAVRAPIRQLSKPIPNPFTFLILRILSVSVMRIPAASAAIKRILAHLLIQSRGADVGINHRLIRLGPDLSIENRPETRKPLAALSPRRPFSVIHMASQGYWQMQDDCPASVELATSGDPDRGAAP
jgi:hypothetical protein